MDRPLITIGITCFAEGDWLLECWESVLAQTDDRWTAVVVMDGTTHQRTKDIFDRMDHPKLRKFAMPNNVGPYPVRNKAFELTETPYHFYLDADDRLPPDAISAVLDTFARFPEAGYVYGDLQCFDGSHISRWNFLPSYSGEDLVQNQHPPGACAYKKIVWEELGGFANELAGGMGDYDFFIGATEQGIVGTHCGRVLYSYRLRPHGRVSQSYRSRYHERCEIIVRRHPGFFADSERRRRFMGLAFAVSANACFYSGDYSHSIEYARRAAELGEKTMLARLQKNWRYKVPPWVVPMGDSAIRLATRLGLLK